MPERDQAPREPVSAPRGRERPDEHWKRKKRRILLLPVRVVRLRMLEASELPVVKKRRQTRATGPGTNEGRSSGNSTRRTDQELCSFFFSMISGHLCFRDDTQGPPRGAAAKTCPNSSRQHRGNSPSPAVHADGSFSDPGDQLGHAAVVGHRTTEKTRKNVMRKMRKIQMHVTSESLMRTGNW